MRCQPDSATRHTNTPKARTHGVTMKLVMAAEVSSGGGGASGRESSDEERDTG
jgi:hypothetical protein